MHTILVLYPPQPDPDAFIAYYRATHLPLCAKLPGLRAMRHSFAVAGLTGPSPWFCVFEAEFDDEAAMAAAMASPEGAAVAADGPNYAQVPPSIVHFASEAGR